MKTIEARMDRLIEIAEQTGVSLDYLVREYGRCSQRDFDALSDNPSRLPKYMKSRVSP